MSDEIYNKLCAVFFLEQERLRNKVNELESILPASGYNPSLLVDYIRAKAVREYFDSYLIDVLNYLKHFK